MLSNNPFNAFIDDSDSDGEIEETQEQKQAALLLAAAARAVEEWKGSGDKWADWCWTEEDDERYRLGQIKAEIAAKVEAEKPVQPTEGSLSCACGNCSYRTHSDPPVHFHFIDAPYCCSMCRISGGTTHGGHCQKNSV